LINDKLLHLVLIIITIVLLSLSAVHIYSSVTHSIYTWRKQPVKITL